VRGVENEGEASDVYNLRVAEDHTYFVGAENWGFSVWAHNACWYHGTDSNSANDILTNGLNADNMRDAGAQTGGADLTGFHVFPDPSDAEDFANDVSLPPPVGRGGTPVVLGADDAVIGPFLQPRPDPHGGEMVIPPDQFPNVPPGAFRPVPIPPGGFPRPFFRP
jgi:hypothetical protein